jgi:hypothetical protein
MLLNTAENWNCPTNITTADLDINHCPLIGNMMFRKLDAASETSWFKNKIVDNVQNSDSYINTPSS